MAHFVAMDKPPGAEGSYLVVIFDVDVSVDGFPGLVAFTSTSTTIWF
jgi:hypothetical protein